MYILPVLLTHSLRCCAVRLPYMCYIVQCLFFWHPSSIFSNHLTLYTHLSLSENTVRSLRLPPNHSNALFLIKKKKYMFAPTPGPIRYVHDFILFFIILFVFISYFVYFFSLSIFTNPKYPTHIV